MRDPFGLNNYPDFLGRDGCRTPLPWDSEKDNFGFTKAEKAWLPTPAGHAYLAINKQNEMRQSLLNKYRRLIMWRKKQPALVNSLKINMLDAQKGVLAYVRGEDTARPLLFLLNMTDKIIHQEMNYFNSYNVNLDSIDGSIRQFDACVELPPYGCCIAKIDKE